MRRSVPLPLICMLALATGIALLGTGTLIAGPALEAGSPFAQDDAAAANIALVRRFYAAVNEALQTGEASSLDGVVAVNFVDRTARPGFTPTRDGLARHLLALRATFPAMRLTPEEPIAQGDSVLARVWVEGAVDGVFLGVPLAGLPPTWETHDLFRIAGDRIVERRGAGDWPVLPSPLGQAPLRGRRQRPSSGWRATPTRRARQPRMGDLGPLLLAVGPAPSPPRWTGRRCSRAVRRTGWAARSRRLRRWGLMSCCTPGMASSSPPASATHFATPNRRPPSCWP